MLRPPRWLGLKSSSAVFIADVVERRAVQVGAAADEERVSLASGCSTSWPALRVAIFVSAGNSGTAARSAATSGALCAVPSRRCATATPPRTASSSASVGFAAFHASNVFFHAGVLGAERRAVLREVRAHLRRDEEVLLRQTEVLARRVGELRAALAVRLLRAGDLGDALADERLRDDELRLAAARLLRALERGAKASMSCPSTVSTSQPIASKRFAASSLCVASPWRRA